jgi:hypothetical protein
MPVDSTYFLSGLAGDATFTGSNSNPPVENPPANNGSGVMVNKINSDVTGLSYAEELTLKNLPLTPVWYELEPNSYRDTGGNITTVARTPIRRSRQRLKGSPVDIDVALGFNQDVTQRNLTRLLQGFFFADAFEKSKTQPLNGTQIAMTAVATDGFTASAGLTIFKSGDIVNGRNFATPNNNGPAVVTAVAAGKVTVGKALTAEATPPANAHISAVGFQFASADVALTTGGGLTTLTATAGDFTALKLNVGEWIFIGGDLAGTRYANNVGFARIQSIAAKSLVLDKVGFTPVNEDGAGKTLQIFFGDFLRNATVQNPELIKTRSYNVERRLGSDANGEQSQYFEGSVANSITLNIPGQDKLNADIEFVPLNDAYRNGTQGLKTGTRVASAGEAAFNTSLDVVRCKMSIVGSQTPLFAYITEGTATISNNVTVDKAVGVFGGFDVTLGDFEVGGSVTAYFADVEAVRAIRTNADVTLDFIFAHLNGAIIYDIPLLTLGGGRLNVEKGRPVTIPLDTQAAQSVAGYTLGMCFMNYVPNIAMPVV